MVFPKKIFGIGICFLIVSVCLPSKADQNHMDALFNELKNQQ